ncbi:MAG: acyl carrier protein [Lachnospiraceae bacterium]|jgi:D-alanine--poly(phosphoribitol) ligase subunit 2|nr:acyl carrier protein [Lachnospiraceae bacterium]
METLRNILMEIDDSIDWNSKKALIDDGLIDSFAVISLVAELEDQFSIEVDTAEIIPENFNSLEAIWNMVRRLQGK